MFKLRSVSHGIDVVVAFIRLKHPKPFEMARLTVSTILFSNFITTFKLNKRLAMFLAKLMTFGTKRLIWSWRILQKNNAKTTKNNRPKEQNTSYAL